jgi:very-short-patch-repair endonuclease
VKSLLLRNSPSGESDVASAQNSPSNVKGWQSKTDGVDAHHINNHTIQKRYTTNLPHNSNLKQTTKALRKAGVLSEVLFWQQVHKKKFYGIDFDRQCIIGNYIVDYYIPSLSVVIETDGSSHVHKGAYDQQRQSFLASLGLHVYRVQNSNVKSLLLRNSPSGESDVASAQNSPSPVKGWTRSGRGS